MSLIGFIPPHTQVGVAGLFWSLAYELNRTFNDFQCLVPDWWVYPKMTKVELATQTYKNSEEQIKIFQERPHPSKTTLVFCESSPVVSLQMFCLFVGPTLEDIARGRRIREILIKEGVQPGQILNILVNAGLPGGITSSLIKEQLPPLDAIFPYDPSFLLHVENKAVPLQLIKPRSGMAMAIEKLTLSIKESLALKPTQGEISMENLERQVIDNVWKFFGKGELEGGLESNQLLTMIDKELHAVLVGYDRALSKKQIEQLREGIVDQVMGYGPLEKYLKNNQINEVMVNGPNQIYVEQHGHMEKVQDTFSSHTQLRVIIDRMVGGVGRRVDMASPYCDVRIKKGSRVNVVLPPLSLNGPLITLRCFTDSFLSMEDLVKHGTLTREQGATLKQCVIDRKNICIAGNAGCGKTTLLNILSQFIESSERIITIEDAAELKLQQPHVVRLETRSKNSEGEGEVTMSDLVINTLRMRPDRLVIGECRGAESIPMLQAMNTGHDGSMTTLHANSAQDAIQRLESMVLLGAPQWPIEMVRQLIGTGINIIVYLRRTGSARQLVTIGEVKMNGHRVTVNE